MSIAINAACRIDGTPTNPVFVGKPGGVRSIVRTPGGSAAGDYILTLTNAVADEDMVLTSNPEQPGGDVIGPDRVVIFWEGVSTTNKRIFINDSETGEPTDTLFSLLVVRSFGAT